MVNFRSLFLPLPHSTPLLQDRRFTRSHSLALPVRSNPLSRSLDNAFPCMHDIEQHRRNRNHADGKGTAIQQGRFPVCEEAG
jgi:hypothetical protein